ncbi:hypothetical protein Dimus_019726 [Dionaea muscipula]
MKKTFYYNFFQTKEEEVSSSSSRRPTHQVSRVMLEIRDDHILAPSMDSNAYNNINVIIDPWKIKKRLTREEVSTGRMILSLNDTMEQVFRYWPLEKARNVELGARAHVVLWDVTDESSPCKYGDGPASEAVVLEKGLQDCFELTLNMGIIQARGVGSGDEIGLYWDVRTQGFVFKLFR